MYVTRFLESVARYPHPTMCKMHVWFRYQLNTLSAIVDWSTGVPQREWTGGAPSRRDGGSSRQRAQEKQKTFRSRALPLALGQVTVCITIS